MLRALFEKKDNAIYISHLDLMRLFQRAFQRADLPLTHTQGFNQRPSVSMALPLSLGVESQCELLDFALEGEAVPCNAICQRLNAALPAGVRVRQVYEGGRKLKELALLQCQLVFEYDGGVPEGAAEAIQALFARESLWVEKKGKHGLTQQDIIPMIRQLTTETTGSELVINARICCQNPSLNPMQLAAAVETYLPERKPDFVRCRRVEIYDEMNQVFR